MHDLVERRLGEPALVISDGNPGLKKALRRVWRCQRHKMLNILAKLPPQVHAELKPLIQQVFWAPSYEEGLRRGRAQAGTAGERRTAGPDRSDGSGREEPTPGKCVGTGKLKELTEEASMP